MNMRATKLATILDDGSLLELPEGETISLKTRKFTLWLSNPENRSFRFITGLGGEQSFTARKETSKKGEGDYWYGYRKVEGRLHKRYIGKSEDVTLLRLKEVAVTLDTPATPRQHAERTKLDSYLNESVTSDEVNRLRTELETAQLKVTSLQSELEAALGESAA
jgi:hypothetical protein